jgi:GNAT superfamily N-acetyltransferase
MSGESGAKDPRYTPDVEQPAGRDMLSGLGELERRAMLTWVGEHLPEVRRSAYGQRILYWTLGIGFVVGLAAYVGGYALRSSVTTEPLEFVGDLLYTLGWALWTGVVVVLFLQVLPEAKRRGYKQLLDAYEATLSEKARAKATGRRGTTDRRCRGSGQGETAPAGHGHPSVAHERRPRRPARVPGLSGGVRIRV